MEKILLIEDERRILQIIRDALEDKGFLVMASKNGKEGLDIALKENVDLVILDLMLPGMDGFDVCARIKKRKAVLPIIMLTARSGESDKVRGLDSGADDYVTKPFSIKELIARVNACLRSVNVHRAAKGGRTNIFEFGDIKIDFVKMEAHKKKKNIKFTKREYDILRYMINRKAEVVSRNDLLDVIWGFESAPLTRTVDTFMSRIRKKIEDKPAKPVYLKSIRDVGYKLDV